VLTSPEAYAAAEVHGIIYRNILSALTRMGAAAARAVAILDDELGRSGRPGPRSSTSSDRGADRLDID
jgi:hypothetical protein